MTNEKTRNYANEILNNLGERYNQRWNTPEGKTFLFQVANGAAVEWFCGGRWVGPECSFNFTFPPETYRLVMPPVATPEDDLTVHALRSAGFKVCITHRRWYWYMTAGVLKKLLLSDYDADTYLFASEKKNGLQSKGGETFISITNAGYTWETTVVCSETDNFNHKTGIKIALNRLEKEILPVQKTEQFYGVFSNQAAMGYGTALYSTKNGDNVHITCVVRNVDDYLNYGWNDKTLIGPVEKCIRGVSFYSW